MAKENYTIKFEGFWREASERELPMASGVYCVFDARMVLATGALYPQKVIYIARTSNAKRDISQHPDKKKWREHLSRGNHLCYSFARVDAKDATRVMAALVHHHKPPLNEQYKKVFPFERTHVLLAGKVGILGAFVTVNRTKGII